MPPTTSNEPTSAQKSGLTKRQAYGNKVKMALNELTADPERKSIFLKDICDHAGVRTDSIYKPYHRELRGYIDRELQAWAASKHRKRPKRLPLTELQAQTEQLKKENTELDRKLRNAQRALNVLGQMLESALSTRGTPAVLPMRRPGKAN